MVGAFNSVLTQMSIRLAGLYPWFHSQPVAASRNHLDSILWLALLFFPYQGLQEVLAGIVLRIKPLSDTPVLFPDYSRLCGSSFFILTVFFSAPGF